LNLTNFEASKEIFSNESLMKEFMIFIDFLETPTSGWTYFNTL
jgi:hypothetical protein